MKNWLYQSAVKGSIWKVKKRFFNQFIYIDMARVENWCVSGRHTLSPNRVKLNFSFLIKPFHYLSVKSSFEHFSKLHTKTINLRKLLSDFLWNILHGSNMEPYENFKFLENFTFYGKAVSIEIRKDSGRLASLKICTFT